MVDGQVDCGQRTTRKPHDCAYCGIEIPAGTRVFWWTRVDDGRIYTSRSHLECQAAQDWARREFGLSGDEPLVDPAAFRGETLAEYRQVVSAASGVGAETGGSPHESGEV